jgi:hypothetical protein
MGVPGCLHTQVISLSIVYLLPGPAPEAGKDYKNSSIRHIHQCIQDKADHTTTYESNLMGHTQADMNKAMGQGIEDMQLLMMKTVFLGGLREEIQNRVLEDALTQPKLSVAVAHEIESIPNDKKALP